MMMHVAARSGERRRGFTLVEMLVAVAAVTLIILGVTRIFAATGETVRAGRRVSYLNTYAGLMEQQLREDIASMTRDGFLLIRHEVVQNVKLTSDDLVGRDRRADELLFFAKGAFRSKREPIVPGTVAEATAARIYYGHGVKAEDPRVAPAITEMTPPSNLLEPLGRGNNSLASGWILLRQVTLLAQPSAVKRQPFPSIIGYAPDSEQDSDIQYAHQPAAVDIFRNFLERRVGGSMARLQPRQSRAPLFWNGMVDIATTDLAAIRAVVLDAQSWSSARYPFDPASDDPGVAFKPSPTVGAGSDADLMQQWMRLALPVNSDASPDPHVTREPVGVRMRCELSPPNLLGLSVAGLPESTNPTFRDEVRMDQLMLSASNFVPHCTEFMVEWSFGEPAVTAGSPTGELQWFGTPLNAPGDMRPQRYLNNSSDRFDRTIRRAPGSTPLTRTVATPAELIHGLSGGNNFVYAYFGYIDPTYVPEPDVSDANGNTVYEPNDGDITSEPLSMPWPWPKLLRITITLVDPNDPTVEQRYQYVFEVPEGSSVQ